MDQDIKQQFDKMDERFDKIDRRFEKTDQKFEELLLTVKDGFDEVSGRLDNVEQDVKVIKSTMATKEFVTEKLADLGAEIGKRINRSNDENRLFAKRLVEFLKKDNGVLKKEHVAELEEMLV